MSKTLRDLMNGLGGSDRRDEIFAASLVILALMEEAGWDTSAFSGVMAAYFCPDEETKKGWLEGIAKACDEEIAKVPVAEYINEMLASVLTDSRDEILSANVVDTLH